MFGKRKRVVVETKDRLEAIKCVGNGTLLNNIYVYKNKLGYVYVKTFVEVSCETKIIWKDILSKITYLKLFYTHY